MILDALTLPRAEFEKRTGWEFKPQGACKDGVCVPLRFEIRDQIYVRAMANALHLPLVHDEANNLWSLGPEGGRRILNTTRAPAFTLPDWKGNLFSLDALRGKKILLVAWASW